LDELIVNNKRIGVSACLAGEICRYDGKYNGTFSGIKKNGIGVTTALFRKNIILVYSDKEIGGLVMPFRVSMLWTQRRNLY
jgi:uncharacterized protein YbbK (DUF523 family)